MSASGNDSGGQGSDPSGGKRRAAYNKRSQGRGNGGRGSGGGQGREKGSGKGGHHDQRRFVAGLHPVRELLRSGQTVRKVMIDRDRDASEVVDEIVALANAAGVEVESVDRERVNKLARAHVHQGVVAIAPPYPYRQLRDLLDTIVAGDTPGLLVALDGVTDPHNLGSVARTAEAVGAHGLIVPQRRAAGVTATAEKSAAGALAYLPVAQVPNFSRALRTVKESGFWTVGLDSDAETSIFSLGVLNEPVCLVIGSEGKGLARSSYVHCDSLVRLPMQGNVGSLNASVAAAVALYEVRRTRDAG